MAIGMGVGVMVTWMWKVPCRWNTDGVTREVRFMKRGEDLEVEGAWHWGVYLFTPKLRIQGTQIAMPNPSPSSDTGGS